MTSEILRRIVKLIIAESHELCINCKQIEKEKQIF